MDLGSCNQCVSLFCLHVDYEKTLQSRAWQVLISMRSAQATDRRLQELVQQRRVKELSIRQFVQDPLRC
jgi:hypothetical protein